MAGTGRIVRYEFLGSRVYVFFAFLFVVTIPLGIIHMIETTVRVDEELQNPSQFLEQHKAKYRLGS